MAQAPGPSPLPDLPRQPVQAVLGPLQRFLHVEAASGVVLLVATAAALLLANSPLSDDFLSIWKTRVGFEIGSFSMNHSLQHWINDGLMAIFFFVIGLEMKREIVLGELNDMRRAALPIFAAIGGMVVPAGLYFAMQSGQPGASGWGIPMATDIAFVVGCMAVLGSRIPKGLRILLLSLAIVDDLGAILVIAVGYTDSLDTTALMLGFAGIVLVLALARIGVRSIAVYTIAGTLVWLAFHESGVHATIAGVILGLITPARNWVGHGLVAETVARASSLMSGSAGLADGSRYGVLRQLERTSRESLSPLERIETVMHPWVGFVIMPVFALANAGVPLRVDAFTEPVALAVIVGLVVGKPVGVVLASAMATRLGIAELPKGVGWGAIVAGGFLAGIGFTMALFISSLALGDDLLDTAKMGVLAASGICVVVGMALLVVLLPKAAPAGSD